MNSFNHLVIMIYDLDLKGWASSGMNILLGLLFVRVNVVLCDKIGVI